MERVWARLVLALFLGVAVLGSVLPHRAAALNLQMVFDSGASAFPSYDPDGSKLIALFAYAEQYYEAVFQDSHTIRIDFEYEPIDGNTIGRHTLEDQNGLFGGTGNYRENRGRIRIDPDVNWFVDTTPADHSEFNMQQTLWRDLTTAQREDFYNDIGSNVPATFEVGYQGNARSGSAASGKTDMLSVVLHEVGHAIGMSSSNYATIHETSSIFLIGGEDDRDYDFSSSWIGGASLAVQTANDAGEDGENIAHLESSYALMNPSIPGSRRRLPSHTDLMAMAASHHYTDLDVPRREFYSNTNGTNTNWNDTANWTGAERPESNDDAYVRAARGSGVSITAGLTANGVAANLYVSEGSDVDTNGFKLDIGGTVSVSSAGSVIYIDPSGELEAATAIINSDAQIRMAGGTLDVDFLTINAAGSLRADKQGSGTVQVDDLLVNNGSIVTELTNSLPATLNFSATGVANVWDLDGTTEQGVVQATGGDVLFNSGNLADSFNGTMQVGSGYRIHLANAWTNAGGTLDLRGGDSTATAARLTGGKITFTGGTLDADDGGTSIARIESEFAATGGNITLGGSDSLVLTAATTLGNTTVGMASNSKLVVEGAVAFSGTTNVNASASGARVELKGPVNWGTGTLNLNSSNLKLAVTTSSGAAWNMSGKLKVVAAGAGTSPIEGSPLQLSGTLEWQQTGTLAVDATIVSTGRITLANAADRLELAGDTTFRSGSQSSGAGTLHNLDNSTLSVERNVVLGNFRNSGDMEFGSTLGIVNATQLTLDATSNITFAVGGASRSTQYGSIATTAATTLGGTATVEFVNTGSGVYSPTTTTSFVLVSSSANLAGSFQEIVLPALTRPGWWTTTPAARLVTVTAVVPLPGDVNLDGQLTAGSGNPLTDDVAAFVAGWRSVLPTDVNEAAWRKGDLNLDGVSDLQDAFLLRRALQSSGGAALESFTAIFGDVATVPEPATIVPVTCMLAAGLVLYRRRLSR